MVKSGFLWWGVLGCLVVGLIGCEPTGLDFSAEATTLVNESIDNRVNLNSITARGEMKIVDKKNNFSLSVKIEMAALYPDHMRIRATKLAEAVVAFDMLMQGQNVAFYVPRRNTLYTGSVNDLKNGGVNFSPDMVIARVLKPDRSLLDRKWRVIGARKDGLFSKNLVLEELHPKGQPYVRIHLDGQRKTLVKALHFDKTGKLSFMEEYSGYRELDSGKTTLSGRSIGTGTYFPSSYYLSWPDKERSVRVVLRRYEFDVPANQLSEFWTIGDLDLDSVRRRKLADIQVDSDSAGR